MASSGSRMFVIVAAGVYVAFLPYYAGHVWPPFRLATVFAAAYGFVAARGRHDLALWPGLALTFLVPGLFVLHTGYFYWPCHALWMAMLLGMVASLPSSRWSLPSALEVPLVAWGMIAAVTAGVIMAREADFNTVPLRSFTVVNSGIPAALIVEWVALTAGSLLVGILWLDYLFARYGENPDRFFTRILLPFGAGWLVNVAVAIYQWGVDPTFLAQGFWVSLGRTEGMVRDANGFGALCALWGTALAALTLRARRRAIAVLFGGILLAVTWSGVWASGSRGALVLAVAGSIALLIAWARRIERRSASALVVIIALGGGTVALALIRDTGPLQRLSTIKQEFIRSPRAALVSVWERDGYGRAAVRMIAEHPTAGVGIGLFHSRVADYSVATPLPPDNAQNWYRHQLAELGIVGSVGWVLWVGVAVFCLITAHPSRPDVAVVRWILVAFGLLATVAMPGQDPFVAITFWTLTFWFIGGASFQNEKLTRARTDAWTWVLIWAIAILNLAVVGVQSSWSMRPPVRAARRDTDYSYGLQFDRSRITMTARRAVVVPSAADRWLKLTYWTEHPDADRTRLRADIWCNGQRIVAQKLSRNVPVTQYVPLTRGKRFVLEAKVDRVFTTNGTERGLEMKWEFVPNAPPGVSLPR